MTTETTGHHHLDSPATVIRRAVPAVSGFYGEMTSADAEKIIQALRDAGYSLLQPTCEACDA